MNENYPHKGYDFYFGNDISNWTKITPGIEFAYYRLGQGASTDDQQLLDNMVIFTAWRLGAYFVVDLPSVARAFQLQTLQDAIKQAQTKHGADVFSLPTAIDFEQLQYFNKQKRLVSAFPSVADALALYNAVSPAVLYTNLAGMQVIHDSGLVVMNELFWWIARDPGNKAGGEFSIDDTLAYVEKIYGVDKAHVLFVQTTPHGDYPAGASKDIDADIDRAVSFAFDTPLPPPALDSVNIVVQSSDPKTTLQSVMVDGVEKLDHAQIQVIIPAPVPAPIPPPISKANRYRILYDFEMPASYYGGKARTAASDWHGNPITPATCRINGVKSAYTLTQSEVDAIAKINAPFPKALHYVSAPNGGWVNQGAWPLVQTLTFEGNVVDVLSIDESKNQAFIRVWAGEDGSGIDDDCVIHHWTNIGNQGQIYTGSWKGPAFIALMYEAGAWIELDKLVKV